MKLGKIEYKKFNLTDEDYQNIYDMYKGDTMQKEIGVKYKLSPSKVMSVMNQISNIELQKKKIFGSIIEEKQLEPESWKRLCFPVDNDATIGNVVIKNKRLIQDGVDITENYF